MIWTRESDHRWTASDGSGYSARVDDLCDELWPSADHFSVVPCHGLSFRVATNSLDELKTLVTADAMRWYLGRRNPNGKR